MTPLSLTILMTSFGPEHRGRIVGIWGTISGLAIASGPLVGGAVTQGLDWHWIFWVNVPVGIGAAVLVRLRLDETRGPARPLDLPGAVLVAGASGAIVWGLVRSTGAGWSSAQVVLGIGAGALLGAAFILRERLARSPTVPPGLFRRPSFAAAVMASILRQAAAFSAAFLLSQYFQMALGFSPLETGLRLLPWTAMPLLIAPLAGAVADRIGPRPLMVAGLLLQAIGLAWVAAVATSAAGYGSLIVPFVVAGAGVSMAIPTSPVAAFSALPDQEMGTASGVLNMGQRLGGALGVAAASAVFAANGHIGAAQAVDAGFRPALTVSAALSLAGAVAALFVAGRPRRAAEDGVRDEEAVSVIEAA